MKVARLRRRFCFVSQQALSFRTRHHLCRQGVAHAGTRQLRSQGPMFVHAHRTEGVTGSKGGTGRSERGRGRDRSRGREQKMERVGVGNGDVDVDGDRDGAGPGPRTGTGVEANEGM